MLRPMAKMTLNTLLAQALASIQRGEASRALQALDALPAQARRDPNVLHVRGLALKAQGDLVSAEQALRRAVAAAPQHAALLNNFANVLNDLDRRHEAAQAYRQAIALQPDFVDGHRNLGIVLSAMGQHEEALRALQAAQGLAAGDVRTLSAMGAALNALERPTEAETVLRDALAKAPEHALALHHLGVSLRLQERLEEAREALERARALAPTRPEIVHACATIAFERNEYDAAERAYQEAIALRPDFVEAHSTLNELYWQRGQFERYGESYAEVHRQHGWRSAALAAAWVRSLVLANRAEQAQGLARQAAQALGPDPDLLRWQARAERALGQPQAMLATLEQAVVADGERTGSHAVPLRQDLAEALLRAGRPEQADAVVDELLSLAPDDQLTWAWRSTVWRQLEDERYHALHQDFDHVRAWELPTPPGYDSLPAFLSALSDTLLSMHRMVARPLAQTLEHGTQTPGRLLHKPDPVIQALRQAISTVVDEYVADLATDDRHPLLRRCTGQWRFSGSWSVRLQPNGYHVDHVHPAGWISSACYVSLPTALTQPSSEAPEHAGWIGFGRSSLALAEHDTVERYVQPTPGLLVLFPSFTWHGTVPFTGSPEEFRMTAPFDAVPA